MDVELYTGFTNHIDLGLMLDADVDYILCSYLYAGYKNDKVMRMAYEKASSKKLMVDSGVYSMLAAPSQYKSVDLTEYIKGFARFLQEWQVKEAVEVDLYRRLGVKEVERIRRMLEKTGTYIIPVFHRELGHDYWKKLISKYPLVSIGGFAVKDIKRSDFPVIRQLIYEARDQGCRIHGLGFAMWPELLEFDSIDSTAWLAPMWGGMAMFDPRVGYVKVPAPKGRKLPMGIIIRDQKREALRQWKRMQDYVRDQEASKYRRRPSPTARPRKSVRQPARA